MKCYYHGDTDAVAQCVDCGKGLCKECASRFAIPICPECNLKRIKTDKKQLHKNIIIMVIAFIIGFCVSSGQNVGLRLLIGYFFAGIPWGWSVLTRITPNMFLFLSWVGWIIYALLKFCLAAIIGMFVTPYKIYKIVKELSEANEKEKYTKQV